MLTTAIMTTYLFQALFRKHRYEPMTRQSQRIYLESTREEEVRKLGRD